MTKRTEAEEKPGYQIVRNCFLLLHSAERKGDSRRQFFARLPPGLSLAALFPSVMSPLFPPLRRRRRLLLKTFFRERFFVEGGKHTLQKFPPHLPYSLGVSFFSL